MTRRHALIGAFALAAFGASSANPPTDLIPVVAASPALSPPRAIGPGEGPRALAGAVAIAASPSSVRAATRPPDPTRIVLPRIGVDAMLEPLGLNPDGTLEVPRSGRRAGWFTAGAAPGQPGPAVIAGHVSTRAGAAVFARLHESRAGDEIEVRRTDRSTVVYVVDRVERHRKADFPTDEVYGPTVAAELRLITCGGTLDRRTGSYRDNVVVFARLRT